MREFIRKVFVKFLRYPRLFLASEIPWEFMVSGDIRWCHSVGIVISNFATIGKGVMIYSDVTIGGKYIGCELSDYPTIEDGVILYTGAKVVGRVVVGEGAIVGANAVVTKDVPPNTMVVGVNHHCPIPEGHPKL